IYVVPESSDLKIGVYRKLPLPPRTGRRVGEIGEVTPSRPDLRGIGRTVGVLEEHVLLKAFVIHAIPGLYLNAGIADHHHLEAHVAQFADEASWITDVGFVPGEYSVLVHVMDVQHDRVGRYFLFTKGARNAEHLDVRVIAVAALLVANAPAGRQLDPAGEPGVVL